MLGDLTAVGAVGHRAGCGKGAWVICRERMLGPSRETAMTRFTALLAPLFLAASAAWATSTTRQGEGVPAGTGGIAGYWWIIVVVIVVAAIWYFTRRNRTSM